MYELRLPATSANLGPGFDALGLAMGLWLKLRAEQAADFRIDATGRDAAVVGALEHNLMLETYCELAPRGPALSLRVENEIPLGMGCGSSAAALLAGVLLANRFGELGLTAEAVVAEACRREGHPDNVAACFYGGMTVSGMDEEGRVMAASFGKDLPWRLLLALPPEGLATSKARALLPGSYSQADAVKNVQATGLMVAAFAQGRAELLSASGWDRMHHRYRGEVCPLLPRLSPLVNEEGFYSVTLSGAGPSVLLITDGSLEVSAQILRIREAAGDANLEVLETRISGGARGA